MYCMCIAVIELYPEVTVRQYFAAWNSESAYENEIRCILVFNTNISYELGLLI